MFRINQLTENITDETKKNNNEHFVYIYIPVKSIKPICISFFFIYYFFDALKFTIGYGWV